jgi:Fur family transcriptional regulator, ferric uptake regulator
MNMKNDDNLDFALILANHGISKTKFRIYLLNLFYDKQSLTVKEIINKSSNLINKVTIYRALVSFEEKGLIHKVPGSNNVIRYSLCNVDECSSNLHNHNHGHFICNNCNKTFCLEDYKSPDINPIDGFYINSLNLILEGYCKDCYLN